MAHGFLRAIFEIFDRLELPVDLVSTSEVSVSLTLDDGRRLDEAVAALSAFSEVRVERGQAIVCLVGLLGADDTRSQILFATFFLACLLALGLLKLGYFQRLDRLAFLDALEEIRDQTKP